MSDERGARGLAEPGENIDDARRETRLGDELGEAQRRQRRLLRGLQNTGATGRQRGPELPRRHGQRKIPGHDLRDHADRLTRSCRCETSCPAARESKSRTWSLRSWWPSRPCSGSSRGCRRHRPRVAMNLVLPLLMLSSSASSSMFFSIEIRQLPQQRLPVAGQHVTPGALLEGGSRRGHRAIDVGGVGIDDRGDLPPGRRIDHGDALLRFGLDPLPADEQAWRAFQKFGHSRRRLGLSRNLRLGNRGIHLREPPVWDRSIVQCSAPARQAGSTNGEIKFNHEGRGGTRMHQAAPAARAGFRFNELHGPCAPTGIPID